MNKYKKYMIISLTILVISIIGSTFALYTKTLSNDVGINTNTPGLDKYIIYEKGNDITGTLNVSATYLGGTSSNIKFYKKDNTYDIYGKIELTVNEIGTNLSNSKALKYALVNNDNILSEGSLNGTSNGTKITIINNLYLEDTEQIYTIYVWLDINEELGNISGENLDISVDCTADMLPPIILAEHITNLYTNNEKTVIEASSQDSNGNSTTINYNYATSVSLMNDRLGGTTESYDGGNIRYYGASPNNYIYFNCTDYSNQTSDTCELWRIIGVFNGKVKIIRNEPIGEYSWDNGFTTKNNWSNATIMKLLNPSDYYTIDTNDNGYGQSLYYNGQSGKCFSEENGTVVVVDCDFTNTGLKNNITRTLISEETYLLLTNDTSTIYADQMYKYEQTNGSVLSGQNASWTGKIALAYASDFGYAVDLNECTQDLTNYDNIACTSTNWIKQAFDKEYEYHHLLNNSLSQNMFDYTIAVESTGYIENIPTTIPGGINPVLYLKSDITITTTGDGSSSNPYRISI